MCVLRSYSLIIKQWKLQRQSHCFRGDEAVLNINQLKKNFAGFVFTTNLTLWRGVTVTFQKDKNSCQSIGQPELWQGFTCHRLIVQSYSDNRHRCMSMKTAMNSHSYSNSHSEVLRFHLNFHWSMIVAEENHAQLYAHTYNDSAWRGQHRPLLLENGVPHRIVQNWRTWMCKNGKVLYSLNNPLRSGLCTKKHWVTQGHHLTSGQ